MAMFIRIVYAIRSGASMGVVIPIRFREKELEQIDELVKSGIYRSRSEAIRSLSLEAAMRKRADLAGSGLNEATGAILDALRRDRSSVCVTALRRAAEIVGEGRERL